MELSNRLATAQLTLGGGEGSGNAGGVAGESGSARGQRANRPRNTQGRNQAEELRV